MPLVLGIFFAMATTALLGIFLERVMWGPMRTRGAGVLQLILMSIGLALVIRYVIQYIWSTEIRQLDVNVTDTVSFLGVRIGHTKLIVIVVGVVVLVAIGLMLRYALLGKRMRALSDNLELAETAGIDTSRVILWTWIFAGGLAGLAGCDGGEVTDVRPELGFELLLPIFAAVVLGGIGDAFGALAAGLVLGVVIEWSTLVIDALEDLHRVRDPDPRAGDPAAGHLRQGEGDMTGFHDPLFAVTFESFTDVDFWTSVGILAGTYTIFALGLQMNVGYTGIINFGQAGFMAVGAYSMAILTTGGPTATATINFWLSLPLAVLITIAFGLLVGLPSLRLRADYFAIATIAFAEAVRLFALNARS